MTKGSIPILVTMSIKLRMQKYAVTAETIIPMPSGMRSIESFAPNCEPLYRTLIVMIGIDNRNEKRAASSLEYPRAKADEIVIPDLDVPGISANACDNPIRAV